jgi:cell division protein FtsX
MRNALTGVERALFWIRAFAAFAAAAAGLGARAVDRIATNYESQRNTAAFVRVIAPEGPTGMAAAESALAQAPFIARQAPMTAERAATLLQEWGGGDVRAEELPTTPLIQIDLAPSAANLDVSGEIVALLAQGGVTAAVIKAPEAVSGGGVATRVRMAALWGAAAFAVVMALIVSFASRGLAARRRELVTVMCDLGATRTQAAGRIADEATMLGLYAGLLGGALAAAAALVVLVLALPDVRLESLPGMILPIDLSPIIAAPVGAAIAAGVGARTAAGYFHGKAARLG